MPWERAHTFDDAVGASQKLEPLCMGSALGGVTDFTVLGHRWDSEGGGWARACKVQERNDRMENPCRPPIFPPVQPWSLCLHLSLQCPPALVTFSFYKPRGFLLEVPHCYLPPLRILDFILHTLRCQIKKFSVISLAGREISFFLDHVSFRIFSSPPTPTP